MSVLLTDQTPERPDISIASTFSEDHGEISMFSFNEKDEAEVSLWIDEKEQQHEKREVLNQALVQLTKGCYSPVASILNTSSEDVSMSQQYYYRQKMKEVLQAVLSVVVRGQEEVLWSRLREERERPR